MYHITERNERQNHHHALVLAISLHIALGTLLYFSTTGIQAGSAQKSQFSTAKSVEKTNTAPSAKRVNLP